MTDNNKTSLPTKRIPISRHCPFYKAGAFALLTAAALLTGGCGKKDNGETASRTLPPRTPSHSHAAQSATAGGSSVTVPASGEITIDADDKMKFSVTEFTVKPGQTVHLTLRHTGRMPLAAMGHNIAILKAYTNLPSFAQAAATSSQTEYIPRAMRNQVIAHTKMLGGGNSDTITFTAPSEPGSYDFLCTFPAHLSAGMHGKMIVSD